MLHAILKEAIDNEFILALEQPAELHRDALIVRLQNQVVIELRIATANDYAIAWRWGEAELRIDTAPLHLHLSTFPNHLHDADGQLISDPLTRPGDEPWDNVRNVISALLEDPLLQSKIVQR